MRRRAKRIDLEPEVEDACLKDLGALCSDLEHYGKGKVGGIFLSGHKFGEIWNFARKSYLFNSLFSNEKLGNSKNSVFKVLDISDVSVKEAI